MTSRFHIGNRLFRPKMWRQMVLGAFVIGLVALHVPTQAQSPGSGNNSASEHASKADVKKAKRSYEAGLQAEKKEDWETAFSSYSEAVNLAPTDRQYALHREIARSRLVQSKADAAERDAISGRLDDARKELASAIDLDPSNSAIRERLGQLMGVTTGPADKVVSVEIGGEIHLAYRTGTQSFDYRGDTQGAYEELARRFGVEVAFDTDLRSHQVRLQVGDVDFPTAARLLGEMTGTFWRPLTRRLFFVAQDTPQKRKDYGASAVRTVLLPASETPDQMTETLRTVREITGITRSDLDTRSHTLTLRATPQALAVATDLIDGIEQPRAELILEMEILEVDRNYARQLGIIPPQTSTIITPSTQQINEAESSEAGLIDVLTQIFGSSAIPPVIAFGGGVTTYFATMPGVTANFSRMLSLVRDGRRVLLRAQDGEPATFFVGERFPVSLASFSASFLPGTLSGTTGPALVNPIANYPTGNSPDFITTAILRSSVGFNDLIVANSADNTVSVLLGNGDGTFATQVTYLVGMGPASIATGTFDDGPTAVNSNNFIDLAVANKESNTVSILLGNGDGTFQKQTTFATGNSPVSVVAANFHDLNGKGLLDLAVANQADNTISVFQGNGDGTFNTTTPTLIKLPPGFDPTSLVTGNFTNSGHVDLAVLEKPTVTNNNGIVLIYLGNGDGTFNIEPHSPYLVGNSPGFITTGDFNADGILDLAVANTGAPSVSTAGAAVSGNTVSILLGIPNPNQLNVGSGTFGVPTNIAAGTEPTSIAVADYALDGLASLVVTDEADNAVTILLNEGNVTFAALPQIPTGTAPVSVVSADFNGDGRPDAAVADSGSAEATVILNSTSLLGSGVPSTALGEPFPGVEYLDIGLKIKATPRIHDDKEVTLDLSFDVTSLANQSFNSIPVINTEKVEQTVRVRENETAMLAGFTQSQLTNAIVGNPGITDIPGLGLIDQNQNAQQQGTELLFLVTPRMVRTATKQARTIYAGQGALEGPGGEAATAPGFAPPAAQPPQAPQVPEAPPAPQPAPEQPPQTPPGAGQTNPEQPEQPTFPQPGRRPEQ